MERLAVEFDPVPQLSNPGRSSTARGRAQGLQGRQHTTGHARGAQTNTHKAHKRRHTCRKLKATCVPPWPATRSTHRLPIASCVMPKPIECNISMQMSSTENAGKENRGLTLILARSGSPAAPMCGTGTCSLPRGSRCPSTNCHRSQHCTSRTFPWRFDEALCQAQAPPKPASCDHEQLCPCPATAPCRAAPMATTPPESTLRRHPQKDSCSVVTHGVSNTSFSLCQCCLCAAQSWNRDCHHNSPRVLLHPSEQEAFGAVGAQHFWCATPSPWRPKPSVKSSLVPRLAQKLRLTHAKGNTFPTFFSTRLASTSCSKRKGHCVGVSAAPAPKSRQFEAGRHQAERNCLATADDTSDMKPVLTTNRQRRATGRR